MMTIMMAYLFIYGMDKYMNNNWLYFGEISLLILKINLNLYKDQIPVNRFNLLYFFSCRKKDFILVITLRKKII